MLTFLMIAALNLMKLESEPVLYEEFNDATFEVSVQAEAPYTIVSGDELAEGSIITFGRYEQDGNKDNGSEDIEWRVLKLEDGKATLYPTVAFMCGPYWDIDPLLAGLYLTGFDHAEKEIIVSKPKLFTEEEYESFLTYASWSDWAYEPDERFICKACKAVKKEIAFYDCSQYSNYNYWGVDSVLSYQITYDNNCGLLPSLSSVRKMPHSKAKYGICPYIIINVEG